MNSLPHKGFILIVEIEEDNSGRQVHGLEQFLSQPS
jgi:hypothetical protein